MKKLVIVESPTKAKTLRRILGDGYIIKASLGHVMDLPEDELGVDIEKGFEPVYVPVKGKWRVIKDIKETSRKVSDVYLAMDPDREGEIISWHIANFIKSKVPVRRVVFHEITERAIKEAFRSPRDIDGNLVEAQKARRILDRLVGYKMSPVLWEKVRWGISAGRVQSAALRMIVDREREIEDFVPEEYFIIRAVFEKNREVFEAELEERIKDKDEALRIKERVEGSVPEVLRFERKEGYRNPPEPFITSTLQQEAWARYRFSAKKTMFIAQELYEGMDVGEGSVGLITYMRTDSPRLSDVAISMMRKFIEKEYGSEYSSPRNFSPRSKVAQEAHEAIRPTFVYRTPDKLSPYLPADHLKLYELIWRRALASQMARARVENLLADISCGGYIFRARGQRLIFDGFLKIYGSFDEKVIPELKEGEKLILKEVRVIRKTTQPPPRYTEASLIKALESNGIGRPSTYAVIISTLKERGYVRVEKGFLKPTNLGKIVSKLLSEYFPGIVDLKFTAHMEEELDKIASGEKGRKEMLEEFYSSFKDALDKAYKEMPRVKDGKHTG